MAEEEDKAALSLLLTNILYEKKYSNCRLCLQEIKENFVCSDDDVSVNSDPVTFMNLADVLVDIGIELPEEIPGLEAVCFECVQQVIQTYKFITKCQNTKHKLISLFDSLNQSLNIDIDKSKGHENILIIPHTTETKTVFVKKAEKIKQRNVFNTLSGKRIKCECKVCQIDFYKISDLKKHNSEEHNILTCVKCLETFSNYNDYDKHKSRSHKYKCSDCSQSRNTLAELHRHKASVHLGYICKHCGKILRSLISLETHEAKHEDKVFRCPKCGKKYQTNAYYERHKDLCEKGLIVEHPFRDELQRQFVCEHCNKKYSSKHGLRVHIRFVHLNVTSHACEICNKTFSAPSYLRMHMVTHTRERNFCCDLCKKVFVTKAALLYHVRRHTGEKPYSCKMCDERFVNASARAEHIKFKHIGPQMSCDVCSKKFVTSYFLRKHRKRHDNPSSKLYTGRSMFPANMPGEHNMRIPLEV